MTTTDDLWREVAMEEQVAGTFSPAFVDDILARASREHERLDEGDPDRTWLELLAMLLLGVISATDLSDAIKRSQP